VHKSSEVVLKGFLVLLLTGEKVTLCKFWMLETLEVGEDSLLQVVPSVNHAWA
jgi:hypothetical protein